MRVFRWLTIAMLGVLTLAGCSTGETVTAQQIMDGLKQTRENTRDVHAVVAVKTSGEQAGEFVVEAWMAKSDRTDALGKPIGKSHVKVLEASRDELTGSELVNDGETVWIYNPAGKKVITGKIADLKQGNVGAQDPTVQMMRMEEQLQQMLDGSDVEVVGGDETVAEQAVWQVKLTPKPETAEQMQLGSLVETMLWVRKDNYFPLKGIVAAGELGRLEATVREIAIDAGVDEANFSFTAPAGAEVVDAAELARQARPATTTLEGARAEASFTVLSPETLPEGVRLDEVQKLSMGGEAVIQNYSGAIEFSLVQTNGERGFGDGERPLGAESASVTVRGQEGTLVSGSGREQGTLLRWQENGVNIIIAGTLTAEQAQQIAESLR